MEARNTMAKHIREKNLKTRKKAKNHCLKFYFS